MPRTPPARPPPWHTSPRTILVRPPMRSRPRGLPRVKERASAQGDSSADGSATSYRRRFASSYSTTSGCGTRSAGRCSTAESASGRQHCLLHKMKNVLSYFAERQQAQVEPELKALFYQENRQKAD